MHVAVLLQLFQPVELIPRDIAKRYVVDSRSLPISCWFPLLINLIKDIVNKNFGMNFHLSVYLSLCLPACLSACLFVHDHQSVCQSVSLSVCLSGPLSVHSSCLSVCPFVCLWLTISVSLSPPTCTYNQTLLLVYVYLCSFHSCRHNYTYIHAIVCISSPSASLECLLPHHQ